ncbi:MAG: polysaccharide deacetylase family protein [Victivallales bacterium]|nr:polysaccharide deacetylase family protein [Victivallales bacterium]
MKKNIFLSFDVEEFDIPAEYGLKISKDKQFETSLEGLHMILKLLDSFNIRVTMFTTATVALRNRDLIKRISETHEIASHGYDHRELTEYGIKKSKEVLEEITDKPVIGIRSPRLQKLDSSILKKYGYKYNSSENPIYLPGRYNNFFNKRIAYFDRNNILNIPASASPIIRFPLFWLAFKNLPLSIIKFFSAWTLAYDKYLNIYFHPWEFTDISGYNLPKIVKRISGNDMLNKLTNYISFLNDKAEFIKIEDFYYKKNQT